MISVCEEKLNELSSDQISFEVCDFVKWDTKEKYSLITIGQALHWFPIEESLLKMNEILEQDGTLGVYGYIFKEFRDSDGN